MSVYSYSKTVASNTTVGGQTVTDGVMVPSAVDNAFQGVAAEIAEYRDDTGGALATTGSSNAYVLATNATAVLADGASVSFVANFANTGAATLNVDSLGAKAIRKENDQAVVTGDILANGHYIVQYDVSANSAAGAWLLINSSGYADASHTHTLSDVTDSGALAALDTVGTSEIDANAVTLTELEDGTQGDILYYGASGAPTRLGAGTSGQFLKTQGAAANPAWADNTGKWLESTAEQTPSSVLSVVAEGLTGRTQEIIFHLRPATDSVGLLLTVGHGAGPTYLAGSSYDYAGEVREDNGAQLNWNSTTTSSIRLNNNAEDQGNAANEFITGRLIITNFDEASYSHVSGIVTAVDTGGEFHAGYVGGNVRYDGAALTAIKLAFNSGNIAEGYMTVNKLD